jgi:hypothetical protein
MMLVLLDLVVLLANVFGGAGCFFSQLELKSQLVHRRGLTQPMCLQY